MLQIHRSRSWRKAAVGIAVTAIFLAACSSDSTDTTTTSTPQSDTTIAQSNNSTTVAGGQLGEVSYEVEVDPELAARAAVLVPSGVLDLATSAGTPPYEYFQDGTETLRGADIELGYAIAAKLGLEASYSTLEFSGLIPAIDSGRYDFSVAAMGDTPERQKTVDFVDFSTDSNSIVTVKGNPNNITGIDSLCGLDVASVQGTIFLGLLEEQNKNCDPKMNISIFPDSANALLQVQTGRSAATMYQTGTALFLIETDEAAANLEVIGNTEYGKGYNAMAFSKDNSELRDLVRDATQSLLDDGTYEDIHLTWGLSLNMVDEITINDGLKYNQPTG